MSWETVAFLVLAALAAGWVDAVVGGGGLIQLPALLVAPGVGPLAALATNKLSSVAGTSVATITYYRRVGPDLRTAIPMALAAAIASGAGAFVAKLVPADVFKPVIVVALVGVLAYTLLKPDLGSVSALRFSGRRHYGAAVLIGAAIGFYDGILGPGTGSFLVFAMVGVLGYRFLEASAKAKIVNLCTNVGALAVFIPSGHVMWALGAAMAAANMFGGYLGARSAVSGGSRFIRVVFLVVVSALLVRLAYEALA